MARIYLMCIEQRSQILKKKKRSIKNSWSLPKLHQKNSFKLNSQTHPENPPYLLSKQKLLTSVSFALMTPILLFTKGLHPCAVAESVGTEITSDIICQEVPVTWRWERAGMCMESWSVQKPRYVCQTPGQAALMPQTFAFHWSPAALHCSGKGRFGPLERRSGDCEGMLFISHFCNKTGNCCRMYSSPFDILWTNKMVLKLSEGCVGQPAGNH